MITLMDPQTGTLVHLCVAQLDQRCKHCGVPLQGTWAASTEEKGWGCIDHLERVLLDLPLSPEFRSRAAARSQLAGAVPGDRIVATGSLLAALGMQEH